MAARRVPRRGRGLADPRPGDRGAFPARELPQRRRAGCARRALPGGPAARVTCRGRGQGGRRAPGRCRRFRSAAAAPARRARTRSSARKAALRVPSRGPAARTGGAAGARPASPPPARAELARRPTRTRRRPRTRACGCRPGGSATARARRRCLAGRAARVLRPARCVRRDLGGGPARTPLFGEQRDAAARADLRLVRIPGRPARLACLRRDRGEGKAKAAWAAEGAGHGRRPAAGATRLRGHAGVEPLGDGGGQRLLRRRRGRARRPRPAGGGGVRDRLLRRLVPGAAALPVRQHRTRPRARGPQHLWRDRRGPFGRRVGRRAARRRPAVGLLRAERRPVGRERARRRG